MRFDLCVSGLLQDCPEGARDFREEQCSQFDGTDFQGKRYKWLPYYGGVPLSVQADSSVTVTTAELSVEVLFFMCLAAENPCELNCMPRGENFYYRHRSAVVDGTPCHPGRRDVCVAGVCKVRQHIQRQRQPFKLRFMGGMIKLN